MGYTTDFEGSFGLYLPEGPMMAQFLESIRQGDLDAVKVFADWLSDQNDTRGEQVAGLTGLDKDATPFWRLFGLRPEHEAYLRQFSGTRRMKRDPERASRFPDPVREAAGLPLEFEAAYFVGGGGFAGQDRDESILDYNKPPGGQPGLWCQWVPNETGTALIWNGAEKFYSYIDWLEYLIDHFLETWGYVVNGQADWQGEDEDDRGTILVEANCVSSRSR